MIRRGIAPAVTAGLVVAGGGTAVAAPGGDRIDRQVVRRVLDEMVRTGAQGVQVRIADGRHGFTARAGTARVDAPDPVPTDGRFRIAIITKTFVATVVLQLVGEKRVELDAPVSRYLPGLLPNGGAITVRQLLQHTSGLPDHTFELPDDAGFRSFTPDELIALIADKPLEFEPGTASSYSNTNYVVAGVLVERITGRSYADVITHRVLRPLGLRDTSLPGTRVGIPSPHARAYLRFDEEVFDVTEYDPSFIGAAGEMISTTADLNRFVDALPAGRPAAAAGPAAGHDDRGRGVGPGPVRLRGVVRGPGVGHNGRLTGYSSTMAGSADGKRQLTFSVSWAWDFGPVVGRQELLEEVFC